MHKLSVSRLYWINCIINGTNLYYDNFFQFYVIFFKKKKKTNNTYRGKANKELSNSATHCCLITLILNLKLSALLNRFETLNRTEQNMDYIR